MVEVRVPASAANLGPGFDCLGLALSPSFTCGFTPRLEGLQITGCPEQYADEKNLVCRAFTLAFMRLQRPLPGIHLHIQSDIPIARGLGSSAAAIVAGIAGARALCGLPLDREAVFALAAEMEGHPDNVSAAVFGGLRAALCEDGQCLSLPCALSPLLRFTALVPDFELSTGRARSVLPGAVARGDAIYNVAHSLALLSALASGDLALLRLALRDRLHQAFRLPLITGGEGVWQMAEALGAAVCISGAGPTLLCLHQDAGFSRSIGRALPDHWEALDLCTDQEGLSLS
ncbi:MAG: homoserine kinase [Christensenellales bacterium]